MSNGIHDGEWNGYFKTFDGCLLRPGEVDRSYGHHSLNWWRQWSVHEHRERRTTPWNPKELTDLLFEDFENHTGFPNRLPKGTMDEDGAQRLATAIVKRVVDEIMDYEVIKLNGYRELSGYPVGGKSFEAIEQKAKDATRHLLSNYIDTLSMGQSEGILRMIPGTAQRTIESYYSSKTPNSMNLSYIKAKVKKLQRRYPVETLEQEFGMPLEEVLETFNQKNRSNWQERRRLLFKLVDLENARKKGE